MGISIYILSSYIFIWAGVVSWTHYRGEWVPNTKPGTGVPHEWESGTRGENKNYMWTHVIFIHYKYYLVLTYFSYSEKYGCDKNFRIFLLGTYFKVVLFNWTYLILNK